MSGENDRNGLSLGEGLVVLAIAGAMIYAFVVALRWILSTPEGRIVGMILLVFTVVGVACTPTANRRASTNEPATGTSIPLDHRSLGTSEFTFKRIDGQMCASHLGGPWACTPIR